MHVCTYIYIYVYILFCLCKASHSSSEFNVRGQATPRNSPSKAALAEEALCKYQTNKRDSVTLAKDAYTFYKKSDILKFQPPLRQQGFSAACAETS